MAKFDHIFHLFLIIKNSKTTKILSLDVILVIVNMYMVLHLQLWNSSKNASFTATTTYKNNTRNMKKEFQLKTGLYKPQNRENKYCDYRIVRCLQTPKVLK